MNDLKGKIEQAFVDWGQYSGRPAISNWFTGTKFDTVVNVLKGDMNLVAVAADESASETQAYSAAIEQLTREQYDGFKELMVKSRVLVSGPAGSGKTMLAVWAAQSLANIGYKVLIVCFNRNLARWIGVKNELSELVTVRPFHVLCREYATSAGLPFNAPSDKQEKRQFWSSTSAVIFMHAIDIINRQGGEGNHKYDAIVVDEGQDFAEDWWTPLEMLIRNQQSGHFIVFHDPDQAVYSHAEDDGTLEVADAPLPQQAFPDNMHWHTLTRNCRNTKKVVDYCGGVLRTQKPDFQLMPFERSPIGSVPVLLPVIQDTGNRAAKAREVVNGWLREGFSPSQIALISPWGAINSGSILGRIGEIGGHPVMGNEDDIDNWICGDCIWASTIKSFKGMEADCIIIADVPNTGIRGFYLSDMYVAASRAKRNLVFIPTTNQASREIRNWINGN